MSLSRGFTILLLVAIPTVSAVADDEKIDPATLKDKVTIKLDEKFAVEFEQKGDALTAPKKVEKPGEKPPTPTFAFSKLEGQLMLMTKNPYEKDLKFRALMRVKGSKQYVETSIVPVVHGLFGIELWQDPIEELVLFDFKLVDPK